MALKIIQTVKEMRDCVRAFKSQGKTSALVPTMGGLHAGHLSLVERAEEIADNVIVSIFVNPKQFNQTSDFKSYPGSNKEDLASLAKTKTQIVYIPSIEEMYPQGFCTSVTIENSEPILCDAHRPGHFDGVATVVAKLFIQTEADFACFGEKDYQQLTIVRRLTSDLDIPIHIEACKTVRETDGLAMSSRNARLTDEERQIAPQLYKAMQHAAEEIRNGAKVQEACEKYAADLQGFKVEYFELRAGDDLSLLKNYQSGSRLFTAAWLGDVRLIDNIAV